MWITPPRRLTAVFLPSTDARSLSERFTEPSITAERQTELLIAQDTDGQAAGHEGVLGGRS